MSMLRPKFQEPSKPASQGQSKTKIESDRSNPKENSELEVIKLRIDGFRLAASYCLRCSLETKDPKGWWGNVEATYNRYVSESIDWIEYLSKPKNSESDGYNFELLYDKFSNYLNDEFNFYKFTFDKLIAKKGTVKLHQLSFRERIEVLRRYELHHSESETLSYLYVLFPQLKEQAQSVENSAELATPSAPSAATQPELAPILWKDRLMLDATAPDGKPWTPPVFIQEVYSPWLGKDGQPSLIDRPTIRHLDPRLGQALDNWLHKNSMPSNLDLPTARERSEREIDALRARTEDGDVSQILGEFTAREASRIRSNIARREGRKK
jgi:hypothetical protein